MSLLPFPWAQFLHTQHVRSLRPSRSPKSTSSASPAEEAFPDTAPPPVAAAEATGGVGVADGEGVCDLPANTNAVNVYNLSTKEHKSKSAANKQIVNRVQDLAGFWNETKSSESKSGKAQVSIC